MATDPRFCCFFAGRYREAHLLPESLDDSGSIVAPRARRGVDR